MLCLMIDKRLLVEQMMLNVCRILSIIFSFAQSNLLFLQTSVIISIYLFNIVKNLYRYMYKYIYEYMYKYIYKYIYNIYIYVYIYVHIYTGIYIYIYIFYVNLCQVLYVLFLINFSFIYIKY